MRRLTTLALVLVLTTCLVSPCLGQNLVQTTFGKKHRSLFGVKGGIINRTDFRVTGKGDDITSEDLPTRIGLSFGFFFDLPVNRWIMAGLTTDMHDIHARSKRQPMLDIGLSLKFPIYKDLSEIAWKPEIGVGYAYLGEVELLEQTSYTTYKLGLEVIFYGIKRYAYLTELMVYYAPSGGNEKFSIDFGPTVIIRFGVVY